MFRDSSSGTKWGIEIPMNYRVGSHDRVHRRFLVILFGSFEYDGRIQRTLEVISALGTTTLVDICPLGGCMGKTEGIDRIPIEIPFGAGSVIRHLRLWFAAFRVCCRIRPDVVVAANFFTTLPGWVFARLFHAGLLYDAYELIIPEVGCAMSGRDRFWYYLERWVVRRADLVVAANRERAILMQKHYALFCIPEFIRNIPPNAEGISEEVESAPGYSGFSRYGDGEQVLLYQGDMSLGRGIGRFIESLAYLPKTVWLVLAGSGPDEGNITTLIDRLGIGERVLQMGRIPTRDLASISRECDLGIITYPSSGLNNIYCSPNKIFEYAQTGLPVISTDQPPLKSMVEGYGIGRCVSDGDSPAMIAGVIMEIVARGKMGYSGAIEAFLRDHQWKDEATRLYSAVKRVFVRGDVQ